VDETLYFSNATSFEVIDVVGRVLLKSELPVEFVDVSSLQAGFYFVRINNNVQRFVKK
jgi:hypothetical protein